MTDFDAGKSKEDLSIAFTKAWVKDKPYGLEIVSFPHGHNITVCPDLIGRANNEMACLNLYKKGDKYVLKITPAEFKSNKSGIYWTAFMNKDIDALEQEGGVDMIKGVSEKGLGYQLYLEECEFFDEEPLSYNEWLSQEEYEQSQIDRSLMTDAERYGD